MKSKLSDKTKKILDERLNSFTNTKERVSWEEITAKVRIGKGLKDANEGNVKEWKVVKAELLKRVKKNANR